MREREGKEDIKSKGNGEKMATPVIVIEESKERSAPLSKQGSEELSSHADLDWKSIVAYINKMQQRKENNTNKKNIL